MDYFKEEFFFLRKGKNLLNNKDMDIKKTFLLGIAINIISILAIYTSMYKYVKDISANCTDCSYLQDILLNSISILIFPIIYISCRFIKSKNIVLLIISLYATLNVFLGQIGIFNSRVASWSTYTTLDVIVGVFLAQYLGLILVLLIFVLTVKYILDFKMYNRGSINSNL